MSSDDQKQDKQEPVDIDQLEVNIFIIAKNPDQLNNTVQFLTRRGWPTSCIGNISKAIGTIVKVSPDIVMISVDHPNPNVSRLPILLAQTLNTICIGFTEDGGAVSINKLNKSRFKHKFSGFPSGPSVHRYIRQTLDSIYNPEQVSAPSSKRSNAGNQGNQSNTIQVKGGGAGAAIKISGEGSESGNTSIRGGGSRTRLKDLNGSEKKDNNLSAAEMLKKLSQGDDHDPIKKQNNQLAQQSSEINSNSSKISESIRPNHESGTNSQVLQEDSSKGGDGNYYQDVLKNAGSSLSEEERQAKKARVEAKKKAFPWQKDKPDENVPIKNQKNRPGASFDLSQKRTKLQPDADEPQASSGPKDKPHFDLQQGEKSKTNMHIPEAEEKQKNKPPEASELELSKKKNFDTETSDKINKKMSEESLDTNNEKVGGSEPEGFQGAEKKKKRVSKEFVGNKRKLTKEEDKFKESVHKALKESCEEPDPSVLIEIEEIEQLGVIPVDSQKIHGYFLVGRGGIGFSLGTIFLEILSEAVEKHLAMQGIDIHCQKPFLVETENFDLDQFAEKVENFTLFEQSGREEIAVTFVPTKDRIPHLQDSESSPDMAKISAAHLSTQFPINVDSFIFLEKNNRFYKYLKAGSKILQRQKDKLLSKEKGPSGLHINKQEFEKFKQYVAEILIFELVSKVNSESDDGGGSSDDEAA